MLSKLLKYDFRALRRFAVPLLLALAGVTVIGAANSFMYPYFAKMSLAEGASAIWIVLTIISSLFSGIVSMIFIFAISAIMIMILVDFYQSFVTDQAYLTFTLPVRPHKFLISKLLTGGAWFLIVITATLAGMGIISLFGQLGGTSFGVTDTSFWSLFFDVFDGFGESFSETFAPIDTALLLTMIVLLIPVSIFNSFTLYYMAIFFSAVVTKKNRLIVALACVYGANMVYGIVGSIAFAVLFLFAAVLVAVEVSIAFAVNLLLGISLLLLAGSGVLFFFLTKRMMERKLNLP